MSEFSTILTQAEVEESSWFGFSFVLTNQFAGERTRLVEIFSNYGIASRPTVADNFTRNPFMNHLSHVALPNQPNADQVHENGLFIGNHQSPQKIWAAETSFFYSPSMRFSV